MQAMEFSVPGPTQEVPDADVIVDAFLVALNEAGDDALLRQRLGMASVVVELDVRDIPGRRVVVSLTPDDVWAQDAEAERVDVEISLDARDIHELMVGGLALPMKIAADRVTYRGPVRRFLRVIGPLGGLGERYLAAVDEVHHQNGRQP